MSDWTDEAWVAGFRDWVSGGVKAAGYAVTGPVEQPHVRPWSTVFRVPTDGGLLWAKACVAVLAHEARLVEALSRWWPDGMPGLVAVDTERGWLLSRDAGDPLRSAIRTPADLALWHPALTAYAGMQHAVAPRVPELLTLGLPDFRPAGLALRCADLPGTDPALVARVRDLAAELAASGVPDSIDNDDLHDQNVFVQDGHATVIDWGDACVTHPFVSFVVLRRSAVHRVELAEDAVEIEALRDHYLAGFGDPAELRRVADVAHGVGLVVRALAWHHLLNGLEEAEAAPYADAVPGYLEDFRSYSPFV